MKINRIHFRNINSFYGEHPALTFTDGLLAQNGLFVVAGPTGAGKSTLLDVITLALFNRIPRISDTDGRALSREKILAEGLIINQQAFHEPKAFAYAEVDYELKGQAFRSRWSISKNRNGNWNDYEMEVAKLPDGSILSTRKSDIPGLNAEQIGLTYEQFIRSMVLAQGAFDKFLKASSGERSKLLEQLTGTDIYRRLSQRAHQQNREQEELLRAKNQEVSTIRLLPDEKVVELLADRTTIETRLKDVDRELVLYREEATLADTILTTDRELTELDRQQTDLADRKLRFSARHERLIQYEKVADLAPALSDLANAETNQQNALTHRQNATYQLDRLQTDQTRLLTQVGGLLQNATLTEKTFETHVTTFRDNVLALDQQLRSEQERVVRPLQLIEQLIRDVFPDTYQSFGPDTIEQTAAQVADRRQAIGVELVQLESDYPAITPERLPDEIKATYDQINQLSMLIELQQQQQERLTQEMELRKKEDEKWTFVRLNQPILAEIRSQLTEFEHKKQELDRQKVRLAQEANLDELRASLESGQPCPLCGSVEHPYARHYVQQAGTLELQLQILLADSQRKQEEYEALNTQVISATAEGNRLKTQRREVRSDFAANKTRIARQLEVLTLEPELQPGELTDLLQLANGKRTELDQLQTLWKQEKRLDQLADELTTVQESQEHSRQLQQQKDSLYAGPDIKEKSAEWLTQFNQLQTSLSTQHMLLTQASDRFADAAQTIETLLNTLQPILQERGLANVAEARAGLLDATTLRQLQHEQRLLTDDELALTLRRRQAETTRSNAVTARKTDLPPDSVRQRVSDLTIEQRRKTEQLGNVKAQLTANEKDRKRQAKLEAERAQLEAETMPWRELNRLIGSAKGDEFSRFAQSLTLAQLIGLANRRLRDLSDRYLLLKPRDGQDELYVVDQYQGSAERTVTSLSGGETFTLSLAMALALSDLASQNVQIDSLFIDEGFGTLDPESLDTAVAMLEKLQQESQKTIGIISHRHEIKERISVQIQVEKSNDGNSRIRVVEV